VSGALVQKFISAFEAVSGRAHRAKDEAEAAALINRLIAEAGVSRIALAKLPDAIRMGVKAACLESGVAVLEEPYHAATALGEIDRAEIGVSFAEFGIAESGTLVEIATDDALRLVSSLPRTHIGVVYASQLTDTLRSSAARMSEIMRATPSNLAVSYISGPSRTGDIEMILTLGVHGPEHAHAVIIGEPQDA